ncbi:hypothetical protein BJV77DRAFT_410684 [Russula vinacea]|nr:hypothetical protein BJV77DRAFT_410684 [Russula vinacea]
MSPCGVSSAFQTLRLSRFEWRTRAFVPGSILLRVCSPTSRRDAPRTCRPSSASRRTWFLVPSRCRTRICPSVPLIADLFRTRGVATTNPQPKLCCTCRSHPVKTQEASSSIPSTTHAGITRTDLSAYFPPPSGDASGLRLSSSTMSGHSVRGTYRTAHGVCSITAHDDG